MEPSTFYVVFIIVIEKKVKSRLVNIPVSIETSILCKQDNQSGRLSLSEKSPGLVKTTPPYPNLILAHLK